MIDNLPQTLQVIIPVVAAIIAGFKKYRTDVVATLKEEVQVWEKRAARLGEEVESLRKEINDLREENKGLREQLMQFMARPWEKKEDVR